MRDDDDDDNDDDLSLVFYLLSLVFIYFIYYFIYFALKPHLLSSGLKREAKNQYLSLSREHEKRWGGSLAPPLISHLTKVCDEDNNRSPSAPCFCPFICLLLSSV